MRQYHSPEIKVTEISGVSVLLHVGIVSFQMSVWRQLAHRAAPVPTLPHQQPSYSGAAFPAPDDPGQSQIPCPLLGTDKEWVRY